ncbi:MAG: site-2 protease family protein, partial [Acidobacteriota bacterium]
MLTNFFAFFLVLGLLIFIHEFGHFLVAKLLRIRVEVFSLGFGPRLFWFQRGNTEYRISALPLGGSVRMKGENPDDETSGDPDEFLSRPKAQRFLVLVMGATFNILLALVLVA